MARDHNESDLLYRIAKGDERAFSQLFDLYKDKFYTVAFHITKSETSAEELLQDVFLLIWLKRAQLSEIDDFESYFFIVAKHEAYRALKRSVKRKGAMELSEDLLSLPGNESPYAFHDYKDSLHKAIQSLSPQQQKVYRLVKEQGLTREQVAQVLNIEPETVKWHMKKAVKIIRAFLMADLKTVLFLL